MKQLTPKAFADYLAEAAEKIRQDGFSIVKDKPINYGQQIAVQFCEAKASVNIYNGKKGLSIVDNVVIRIGRRRNEQARSTASRIDMPFSRSWLA